MPSDLSPQEKRVRKLIVKKRDTEIAALYRAMYAPERRGYLEPRKMHQAVGAVVRRINQKIADQGIVAKAGKARFTYRLYDFEQSN